MWGSSVSDRAEEVEDSTAVRGRAPREGARERIESAAVEIDLARATLAELLSSEMWDDVAYVRLAALRDDIEALLIGHSWLRGDDGEALAEIREWFHGEALRVQLRAIAGRCPPTDTLTRYALDREARAPRTATASGSEAATRAHAILADDEQDVAAFVSRVTGKPVAASGPAFAALVARIDDVGASERLHAARRALVERRCASLADAVEATVATRRRTVDEVAPDPAIDAFLGELLDVACDDAVALERELRAAVPEARRPLDHVGRVAASLVGFGESTPMSARACIEHASEALSSALDVRIEMDDGSPWTLRVSAADRLLGEVVVDPWAQGVPNRTIALRNRTDHLGIEQHPIAYAQCGLPRYPAWPGRVSVQGAHSLLHELGHGIQHVLSVGTMPSLSGMDRLPVERREAMALWCEKLLYRPGLELPSGWRVVKALEIRRGLVQRATIAIVDRAVLGTKAQRSVVAAFDQIDRTHGIRRFCELRDVLVHFAHGRATTDDGRYYASAIAAAASCEAASEAPPVAWFDADVAAPLPRADAIMRFYRTASLPPRDAR